MAIAGDNDSALKTRGRLYRISVFFAGLFICPRDNRKEPEEIPVSMQNGADITPFKHLAPDFKTVSLIPEPSGQK
jgi:hypothetical protein